MKRQFLTTILCLSMLTVFVSKVEAAEVFRFAQDDLVAMARFVSVDSSGCVLTEVSIDARNQHIEEPTGETESSQVLLVISQFDQCTGTLTRAASGFEFLEPGEFFIDELESATLNAEVEVFDDISGSTLVTGINITWQGIGDSTLTRVHQQTKSKAFTIDLRSSGTQREAAAVGSIVIDGINLTPEPGLESSLSELRSGALRVDRN
jgi:hypothetical protein